MNPRASVERTLADLRRCEKKYVATIQDSNRLEQLGAGNYYLHRLRNNQLLPEAEWDVLKFILQTFPQNSHIVEIGCGWGQMLAMAAAVGYSCVGIDNSVERLAGANFLRGLVDADFPGAAGRLQYLHGEFPSNWEAALRCPAGYEDAALIGFFSNLGLNRPPDFVEACLIECRRFDHVIMDVIRFFGDLHEVDAQDSFIEKMKRFGVNYHSDVHHRQGAHRFIALSVAGSSAPPLGSRNGAGEGRPFIDLHATPMEAVRSKVEVVDDERGGKRGEKIFRLTEDMTSGNGHDVRLAYTGSTRDGFYELVAAFRPRERGHVCIFLHSRWQDQIRFEFDAIRAVATVERTVGDTFQVRRLKSEIRSEWAYLEAEIRISGEPQEVAMSIHLADDAGKYYYDGDGKSGIDVKVLTFNPGS